MTVTVTHDGGKSASVAITVSEPAENTDENLRFSAASLTLHSDISINFKTSAEYFDQSGYDSVYCVFRFNDTERKVTEHRTANGLISFTFKDLAPDKMTDVVTATLYGVKSGESDYEGATIRYSICDYCYGMLDYTDDAYLKTLIVDLLKYGAETQKYTGHRTDSLATSALTADQLALGKDSGSIRAGNQSNTGYVTISDPEVTWEAAGLSLNNSICIRYKLSSESISGLTFTVKDCNGKEFTYTEHDLAAADGGYYLYFDGVEAEQVRKPFYITAYRNGEAVSNTMRYSVESYAYAMIFVNGDYTLFSLLSTLLNYGDSALEFVQSR